MGLQKETLKAVENVIERRSLRGASDKSVIDWLTHLKQDVYKDTGSRQTLDALIDAIQTTPIPYGVKERTKNENTNL
jgi:hypothetical protein